MRLLQQFGQKFDQADKLGRCLIVVATPLEAGPILAALQTKSKVEPWLPLQASDEIDILCSGVGKANASGATAAALARASYSAVLNLGICGSLPPPNSPKLGAVILATASIFADEGIESPEGWQPLSSLGFPAAIDSDLIRPDPRLFAFLKPHADHAGPIVTVSICSGTNARAQSIANRFDPQTIGHPLAEAMEGAAVGLAAARAKIPFAELRVISNTTGDRANQKWNIPNALAKIEDLVRVIA